MLDSRRLAGVALLMLPAGLTAYLAFNSGGFYPAVSAYMAIILAIVLAIRMVASSRPLAGAGRRLAVGGGALALFALLTLLSETWSHTPGLAMASFDRVLLYVLAMVLFGCIAHTPLRLIWILRALAAAIVVVCACGLITRVLPHVWPTSANIANNRLSYPVTYWNVLGLLAVFGIVLCVHFSSGERQPAVARVAGAAATPILATTLYFTFSRGSLLVCVVALIVYVLMARSRGLLSTALSALPATVVVLVIAYDANLLATSNPTTTGAIRQGHGVAVAVLVGTLAAAALRAALARWLDPRLREVRLDPSVTRRLSWGSWAAAVVAAIVLIAVLHGTISHEYHRFLNPGSPGKAGDLRARLTDPGNNGRLDMWRIAWHEFEAKPLLGQGAGTYKDSFAQQRRTNDFVVNAHSLYMETLDELGVVGLALLLVAILTMLLATARRARGGDRPLYAAVFALLLAWGLESGIDWDWQMPVVTIVAFVLGGFMLAGRPRRERTARGEPPHMASSLRTALGVGCLLLAVAPAYEWLSQRKLNQATAAFAAGDYRTATDDALSSISILGIQAQAYQVIAYSDIHRDLPRLAIQAIEKAQSLDPHDWNYAYDLALVRAVDGLNPLAAARRALRLDPREELVQNEWETFKADTPSKWARDARAIADAFTTL